MARRFARVLLHLASLALIAAFLPVAAVPAAAQENPLAPQRLTGVNIAGAEFNGRKIPGIPNTDYFYPAKKTIDHFAAAGMNMIRVPFLWERMQPLLNDALDPAEFKRLDDVVRYANSKGLYVLLDVHNYGYYNRQPIGSDSVPITALASLWGQLAGAYKYNSQVGFGLMNEPKGLVTETWLAAVNDTIAGIRRTGARNRVFVPGNGWTGAHSWFSRSYGTPNADAMLGVVDPADNVVYEVHQYLDSNYSGTHPECRSETVGVKTLEAFTGWLRQHNKRGFLGEFGVGANPTCLVALDAMLAYMDSNRDVWLGWAYWAAGAWPPSYFTSVQPVNGADRPQMTVLSRWLASRPDANTGFGR